MAQALLFVGMLTAIFAIVPVVTLLATGSLRDTWEATKGYAMVWAVIGGAAAILSAVMLLVGLINS